MKTVWQTLYDAKLVEGTEPIKDTLSSPWYVKLLLAFSGWLAAIFMLGFLAVGFRGLIENEIALIIVGILMIFMAYTILKKEVSDFVEHLGLAISVAGQILIIIALFQIMRDQSIALWLTIMLLQISLAMLIPNYIHHLISSLIGAYAFSFVLSFLGMPHLFFPLLMLLIAYLWLNEFHYKNIEKVQAIGYGLVIALLYIEGSIHLHQTLFFWQYSLHQIPLWFAPWLGIIFEGLVLLFVVIQLLHKYEKKLITPLAITSMISIILLAFITIKISGVMVAILILILGFNHTNRILFGLGIISLLFYISTYYYMLEITLLEKAIQLAILGVVLLLGRWFIFHILFNKKQVNNV